MDSTQEPPFSDQRRSPSPRMKSRTTTELAPPKLALWTLRRRPSNAQTPKDTKDNAVEEEDDDRFGTTSTSASDTAPSSRWTLRSNSIAYAYSISPPPRQRQRSHSRFLQLVPDGVEWAVAQGEALLVPDAAQLQRRISIGRLRYGDKLTAETDRAFCVNYLRD